MILEMEYKEKDFITSLLMKYKLTLMKKELGHLPKKQLESIIEIELLTQSAKTDENWEIAKRKIKLFKKRYKGQEKYITKYEERYNSGREQKIF